MFSNDATGLKILADEAWWIGTRKNAGDTTQMMFASEVLTSLSAAILSTAQRGEYLLERDYTMVNWNCAQYVQQELDHARYDATVSYDESTNRAHFLVRWVH